LVWTIWEGGKTIFANRDRTASSLMAI